MRPSSEMRLRWGCVLTLVTALGATQSEAQADSPAPVTAMDAEAFLKRFEDANPRFELAAANVERAKAKIEAARVLPDLGVAYQREQLFPDGGAAAENTLAVDWTLDLSGARGQRVQAARHGLAAARARAEHKRFIMTMDALEVYYRAAHRRLRVAVLREGRVPLARSFEALAKRVGAGDAAGYDLARLELELLRYDQRIAAAQTDELAAAGLISALLGDAQATYVATDSLALAPAPKPAEVLAAGQGRGVDRRSDYRAALADVRGAQSLIDAAGRWWVPKLDLNAGLKTADLGTEIATGFVAGVSLRIPLFSRGRAEASHGAAEERRAKARMRVLEREVPARIRAAKRLLEARIARASEFESTSLSKADAIVKQVGRIYGAGEGSIVELLDAYRISVEVRLTSIDLRWQSRLAEIALWRALGRRL